MKLTCLILSAALVGCASVKHKAEPPSLRRPVAAVPQAAPFPLNGSTRERRIDLVGLQRSLGLDRSRQELGYVEKTFNSCDAGFGYLTTNCRPQTFFSINLRLQCRDTKGTTSEIVTAAQLEPIADKDVSWEIGKLKSTTQTDQEGFAQIKGVSATSQQGTRLRLAVDRQFVYTRAGEVTRIVTPSDWCHSH